METHREYLIKAKIIKLIFFILMSITFPIYLLIANDMNPLVYFLFLPSIFVIYHLINSWHDVYIEDNKIAFHKSIILNT